jgi:hypothetical protein
MDGWTLKFLNVIDEYTRFSLAIRVGRLCQFIDVIDRHDREAAQAVSSANPPAYGLWP